MALGTHCCSPWQPGRTRGSETDPAKALLLTSAEISERNRAQDQARGRMLGSKGRHPDREGTAGALRPREDDGAAPSPMGSKHSPCSPWRLSLPPLGQPLPSFPAGQGEGAACRNMAPSELPLHLGVPEKRQQCPRREGGGAASTPGLCGLALSGSQLGLVLVQCGGRSKSAYTNQRLVKGQGPSRSPEPGTFCSRR